MKFSLDASGAQAMGNGIGSIFKAMAMAPQLRQQAEQVAALRNAQTYGATMTGNKAGAQAEQERFTLDQRQAPVDAALPAYLQTAQRLFQMTGDTNAERVAKAGTAVQTQGIRDQALGAVDDLDRMNRFNTLADPGKTYMPFDNVGNTGRALNKATGEGAVLDDVLAKLFDNELRTEAGANSARAAASYAAANSSNASAGNSTASRDLTLEKLGLLKSTGRLPGSGRTGEDATNAKTRNSIIAAVEKEGATWNWTDDEIMAEVDRRLARRNIGAPAPAAAGGLRTHDGFPARQNPDGTHSTELTVTVTDPRLNGGKPTNIPSLWGGVELDEGAAVKKALESRKQFQSYSSIPAAVEAAKAKSARGGANAPAAGKVQPAPAPAQRTKGAVYETPKGPMKWTGTGWLPAN